MVAFAKTLPKTSSRVTQSTAPAVNQKIQQMIEENVERFCGADRETLDHRIEELDREWDIERMMEVGASAQVLLGLVLGWRMDRRFYGWSALVALFVIGHALFGWFPVLPILRRFGVRTEAEIEEERLALRILRGDFHATDDPLQALAQARLTLGPTISGASLEDTR